MAEAVTKKMWRVLIRVMLWIAVPALLACAWPGRTATSRPAASSLGPDAVDTQRWRVLYRRKGWEGGDVIDLRAVGDIMLGRQVAESAARYGLAYPFAQVRALLDGGVTIGNLESPLTGRRDQVRPGPYRLPARPAFAPQLAAAGFDALALANNHALDAGPGGLQDAIAALTDAGVVPLGAGPDASSGRAPVVLESGGLRLALLAFNAVPDPADRSDEGQGWGRAWLDDGALDAVRQARGRADLVVALVHWGHEYAAQPSQRQREWARKLVAAGADLVVGSHPHALQSAELITSAGRNGYVAFSLGNFVFDQEWSSATSTGAVLRVLLDGAGVALVAAAPIEVVDGQPRPLALESAEAQAALARLVGGEVLQAWSWDGCVATALTVPPNTQLAARPRRLAVDLRGDGRQLWATLDERGRVEVRDRASADAAIVWRNEGSDWRVSRIDAGDPNHDGRTELLLLLWRPDETGVPRSHPFLVGWRAGRYGVIWGGSATPVPIQDAALGDLDGDGRQELVVLEGGSVNGEMAQAMSIWRWFGWGFQREWRAAVRGATALWLVDLSGDHQPEVVVRIRLDVSGLTLSGEIARVFPNYRPCAEDALRQAFSDTLAYADLLRMRDGSLNQPHRSGRQARGVMRIR